MTNAPPGDPSGKTPPGFWWSPTIGLIRGDGNGGYDDAVPLVLAPPGSVAAPPRDDEDELPDAALIAVLRERLALPDDANNDTVLGWLGRWMDDPLNRPAAEPAHEVECPACGATIRARMADGPGEPR
jgi:hypothetical protein